MENSEYNVGCGSVSRKFDIERRLLADMKIPLSAGMLAAASCAREASEATDPLLEADEAASSSAIDIGAFIGGRGALGSVTDLDELVEDLRRALAAKTKKNDVLEGLLDNWIRVETWLGAREITELWSAVLAKLDNDPRPIRLSRGETAQGGGY